MNKMDIKEIKYAENGISNIGVSVVDLYGNNCPACLSVHHLLETVAKDYENVSLLKLNVDENIDEAKKLGVRSLPTLIFFKDGEERHRHSGMISKAEFTKTVNKLLNE